MNELIEEYLRSRSVRYFRGHHDDEFFYLVGVPVSAFRARRAGRLTVHLEVCGPGRDGVRVSIGPDRFYPAARREPLTAIAARWNATDPCVYAVVHDSCDPALVGVEARITRRPVDFAGLADIVDRAVSTSVELFGLMADAAVPDARGTAGLRDAG